MAKRYGSRVGTDHPINRGGKMERLRSAINQLGLKIWVGLFILLSIIAAIYARRKIAEQQVAGGPQVPIPDSPDCSVQLVVELNGRRYYSSEPVTVTATLVVHGACVWQTRETFPTRDFILLVDRTDQWGNVIPLADEETYWENFWLGWGDVPRCVVRSVDAEHPYRQRFPLDLWFEYAHTRSSMYDLSQPGTYTVTLVRLSRFAESGRIPGNAVTFTRIP